MKTVGGMHHQIYLQRRPTSIVKGSYFFLSINAVNYGKWYELGDDWSLDISMIFEGQFNIAVRLLHIYQSIYKYWRYCSGCLHMKDGLFLNIFLELLGNVDRILEIFNSVLNYGRRLQYYLTLAHMKGSFFLIPSLW